MEKEVISFNRLKCCLRGSLIYDSVFIPPPPTSQTTTNAVRSQRTKIDTVERRRSIICRCKEDHKENGKGNKRRTIPTKTHHK